MQKMIILYYNAISVQSKHYPNYDTKLKREDVLDYFNDIENFRYMHRSGMIDDEESLKGLVVE